MKPAPTLPKAAMPVLYHEPHVERGFRPINQPWKSYALSLFQWHNEVMNTWTHLIALFMVIIRGRLWCLEHDIVSDPYMWPLGVAFVSMIILYICSSGAHLFHAKSEIAHYVCFMVDYAGIGLYGFGSAMLHFWYCAHERLRGSYYDQAGIPVAALLGVFTCFCCSYSKIRYQRPYPFVRRLWQIGSVTAIYLWLSFPVWIKIGLYAYEGRWEPSFGDHLQQTMWFILGGFFFGSDIPQRLCPGKFDFVGHSHQLFHICIMMTTYKQLNGVFYDIIHDSDAIRQLPAPTFLGTWGALIFVISGCCLVVFSYYEAAKEELIADIPKNKLLQAERNGKTPNDSSTTFSHPINGGSDQEPKHRNGWSAEAKNGSL